MGNGRDRSVHAPDNAHAANNGHANLGVNMMNERKLIRLKGYDYSSAGCYFVTICTQDHSNWFGQVRDGKMILNDCGKIVETQWQWLAKHYDFVAIDEYCVMPNHFHGILCIKSNAGVGNGRDRSVHAPNDEHAEDDEHAAKGASGSGRLEHKSLPELIGAFKTTSSKMIHAMGSVKFRWQKSYYDEIIRDGAMFYHLCQYIQNNPAQWALDSENAGVGNGRDRSVHAPDSAHPADA